MKRLNWIESIVLPLAAAIFTADWLGLWALWLLRAGQHGVPFPLWPLVMAAVLLAATLLTRAMLLTDQPLPRTRRVIVGGGIIVVVGLNWLSFGYRSPGDILASIVTLKDTLPPDLIAFIFTCFLWWRGITIGRSEIPHESLADAFYNGITALTFLFLVNTFNPLLTPADALGPALLFFASGLGALSLAGLEEDRRRYKDTTGYWPALNRRWLATVCGVIGLIILGGLGEASVMAPGAFQRLVVFFKPAQEILFAIFLIIFFVLAQIVIWPVFYIVQALWGLLANLKGLNLPQAPSDLAQQMQDLLDAITHSPAFQTASQSFTWLVIVLALGFIFWLAARRLWRLTGGGNADEIHESIFSSELLLNQLKNLFSRKSQPPQPGSPYLPLAGPADDPRLIIRRAYQSLLEWAKALGHPRAPKETPLAFANSLIQSTPQHQEAITTLTSAYLTARYAADAPPLEDARRAEAAAAELRQNQTQNNSH